MTEKYREEILRFLHCCLDVMFEYNDDIILIEQNEPEIGKVYKSLKEYKTNPDYFTGFRTALSSEGYKILHDNIDGWTANIFPIKITNKGTYIRIRLDSELHNEESIEMAIAQLKQNVEKESSLIFDKESTTKIEDTSFYIALNQEYREEILMFLACCLDNMSQTDEDVILIEQNRPEIGKVYESLALYKKNPDSFREHHTGLSDASYEILFNNIAGWLVDIYPILVFREMLRKDKSYIRIQFNREFFEQKEIEEAIQKLRGVILQEKIQFLIKSPL